MSYIKDLADRLGEPFPASDIEWRAAQSGISGQGKPWVKVLAYITARAIQDRLDAVVGPLNWQVEQEPIANGQGFACKLSIWDPDKLQWISKVDGAGNTESKQDEDDIGFALKGGMSSALKRVGALWGIGRYLYHLDEDFARVGDGEKTFIKCRDKETGKEIKTRWSPPDLPSWALPGGNKPTPIASAPPRDEQPDARPSKGKEKKAKAPPATGKVNADAIIEAFAPYKVTQDELEIMVCKTKAHWEEADVNVLRHFIKRFLAADLDLNEWQQLVATAKQENSSAHQAKG